jgi:sugar lactone lactonase YvrE
LGPDGRLYIGDEKNNLIRAVDLDTGVIETVVGTGEATFNGDGMGPLETSLNRPSGVVFGPDGAAYILDTYNHRIRRVSL